MARRKIKQTSVAVVSKVREQLLGVVIGASFTGLLSVIVWAFAYFGWINLALPQHFEYETFDHLVRANLPDNYAYSTRKTNLRMNNSESTLVIGSNKELWDFKKDNRSDIILIVDKTKDEYKISYRFEASQYVYEDQKLKQTYDWAQHVNGIKQADINNDGRDEIILGWSVMGAHWNDPAVMVITSNGSDIRTVGVEKYQPVQKTFNYVKVPFENLYDKTQFQTVSTTFFDIKDNQLALVNRTDDACNACQDEAVYSVQFFSLFDNKLTPTYKTIEDVKGYDKIKELLSKDGPSS